MRQWLASEIDTYQVRRVRAASSINPAQTLAALSRAFTVSLQLTMSLKAHELSYILQVFLVCDNFLRVTFGQFIPATDAWQIVALPMPLQSQSTLLYR